MCIASLACHASTDEKEMMDGTAAFVNGETLTVSDVMVNAIFMIRNEQWVAGRSRDEALRAAYSEALEQLIDQKLILATYQKKGEWNLPPWVVDKRVSEIIDSRFDGDRSKLLRELAQQRITFNDWRSRVIEKQIIVGMMRQIHVDNNVHVSPATIRNYYDKNLELFQSHPEVDVNMFYVALREEGDPVATELAVNAAVERLNDGADFGEVGREFDTALKNDGAWGWLNPEEALRPELAQLLDQMDVRATQSLRAEKGFFVVRKNAERPGGTKPFDEVRSNIENLLYHRESQRLYKEWIARLRRNTNVEIFDTFPKQ